MELLGFDVNGEERILRIPFKSLSLEANDIATLIEKAQANELAGEDGHRTAQKANHSRQDQADAYGLPASDLPDVRARAQGGFGRKGL